MPRKASRTDKPSLLFLERTLSGARLQNGPEVRAALNPREFFTETQAHSSSAHKSWISPQFDSTLAAAPPVRRGRRKCHSTTSVFDNSTQLIRKNSVCKFPALSFQTRQGDQTHHPKRTRKKKATESTTGSDVGNQPQGSLQISKTVSSVKCEETPKRQLTTIRKRNVERCSDAASSSNRCVEGPEIQSVQATERCVVPAHGASALALNDFSTTEVSSIGLPPDVDTPKVIQEGISCLSSQSLHLLLPQPCTPPGYQPPDILVADTPERDYGVKVTWRRRRGLMLLLKDRDHLSDSDVLVHS
ncbi:RAD9, HUS1, RAD1-interacting nuclear orphan protein 1 isoform X1 [Notolabrus celidotus]|uniref:RAD9, HUS1, RAD1-interacting nuclear orphan protein 1 isoform X1 n=1 Tax=Notolabrus celidotus TaxID=1203425 RepID=UPI00148F9B3E|nr:RAD9, HUS1, RAD1-interacting nuclear orphan protein 1 isoform X1 [Notolabrus celidotus]